MGFLSLFHRLSRTVGYEAPTMSKLQTETLSKAIAGLLAGRVDKAGPKKKVCVLGDELRCDEAKQAGLDFQTTEDLGKFKKDKKMVKKLAGQYDVFLASPAVIKLIPRLLGPGLNKAGKFPTLIDHKTPITDKVEQMKSTIKFQLKKVICMNVAVGHVKMKPDELDLNIRLAVNFLVSLLKKNWQNIKCLYIKSSMGRPFRIY